MLVFYIHKNQIIGVLITIRGTDEIGKELQIVVRCTGGGVAEVICSTLKEIFTGKF